jgi:hypothetical protein
MQRLWAGCKDAILQRRSAAACLPRWRFGLVLNAGCLRNLLSPFLRDGTMPEGQPNGRQAMSPLTRTTVAKSGQRTPVGSDAAAFDAPWVFATDVAI